jgi:hypothetical protein
MKESAFSTMAIMMQGLGLDAPLHHGRRHHDRSRQYSTLLLQLSLLMEVV